MVVALDNLIDNAMRYSGASREIQIGAGSDSVVEIAIRDYGLGIDAEELKRVTGNFIRGRSTPGPGLGLSIVNQIAKDYGERCASKPRRAQERRQSSCRP